ncbi:plasmid mobilization protein MobA [Salmonella enterica subsp. enterica serovar Typhimurium]|uniref:plasmid mobilization protein MobA n=1 Tax=Salmonella enterica TaxID=28901 RepID=UPI004026EC9A
MSTSEKRQRSEVLLGIRCYPEEKEQIVASARAGGLSTGEYLRRCALGRRIVAKTDTELKKELLRLGGLQKHLYNQMREMMTTELSQEFARTLAEIRIAIVALDLGVDMNEKREGR